MTSQNDIPAAPLSAGEDINLSNPDVVAHLMDGLIIKGRLKKFNGPLQELTISTESGALFKVAFNKLRYLLFKDALSKSVTPHPLEGHPASISESTHKQTYQVVFIDGKSLHGEIRSSLLDEYCLHLFKYTETNSIVRILVPLEVIHKYQIGPLLGQVLLERKVINQKTLDSAISSQNDSGKKAAAKADEVSNSNELKEALSQYVRPEESGAAILSEDEKQLDEALLIHKNKDKRLGEVLRTMGAINNEEIYKALAHKLGLPFVKLRDFDIDPVCVNYLPKEVAASIHAIPLLVVNNRLIVAVDDPTDSDAISMLRFASGHNIELAIAADEDIEWAIRKYYGTLEDEEILRKIDEEKDDTEEDVSTDVYKRIGLEKPIVRLVHNLIVDAINRKASDIHIRPEKNSIDLIFRIDGSLIKIRKFGKSLLPALVSRIKIIGRMNIAERRLPQDGRSQYVTSNAAVDLRISIMPTVDGESVVIRILNTEVGLKTIRELGFEEEDQSALLNILHKSFGMFLVTGPTGSGKSTTLYAALQEIQKQNVNIITVEDPVEYHMGHVEQVQINSVIGYNFARALRNILRHDPDVIMVGEIRDEETAKIAVESALTGHLVLSTLHTNDAPSTIARLLEMGVESYLLNTCLLGVLAQRLVRKNCPHCLEEEVVAKNIREVLDVDDEEIFYHGAGCDECNNTGFSGRLGVYELLVISDDIREYIRAGVTADEIRNVAVRDGMVPLTQNSLAVARSGTISLSEAYRVRLE